MVSLQGYTTWYELSAYNDVADYKGTRKGCPTRPGSITNLLQSKEFQHFSYLVDISGLAGRYDDPQAEFTIFAPKDRSLSPEVKRAITNADKNTAIRIVNMCTLPRVIDERTLLSTRYAKVDTRNDKNTILINCDKIGCFVNDKRVVTADCRLNNGIIYETDGLLIPCDIF
jgi:uncharacterized surface protein with fasciclin (FAS1) repeats